MNYVLAIDQSTQGTKAILFDENGQIVRKAALNHRQIINEKGWVEHDPEEILENVLSVCRSVVEDSCVDREQIRAVGISNQRETVVAWHKATGRPIYNAIVWQCARAKDICDGVSGYAQQVKEKTGIPLSPYFSASKMEWILQNVGAARSLADCGNLCLGTMDSYLVYQLTEEKSFRTDYSNAGRTQLFNIHNLCWDKDLCRLFDIPDGALPEVCMSDSLFGYTTLGGLLEKAIPIHGVLGDSHAALLGQNCRKPGQAKATYGTGSSVMMQTGNRALDSGNGLVTSLAWGLNGKVEYVLEGNLNYTGAVMTWLRDDVRILESDAESDMLAHTANPADRSYFVPAFTGLGAPYWDSDATGMLTGITRTTGKAEIVKACLECIAYQVTDLLVAMKQDSGLPMKTLRVDGGPIGNSYLMQFQSDIAEVTVQIPAFRELSGFGAACAAGLGSGIFSEEKIYAGSVNETYPKMAQDERNRRYQGWKNAVEQVLHHS